MKATKQTVRAEFGRVFDLTNVNVRRRIYAHIASFCRTGHTLPGDRPLPPPSAEVLADILRRLPEA